MDFTQRVSLLRREMIENVHPLEKEVLIGASDAAKAGGAETLSETEFVEGYKIGDDLADVANSMIRDARNFGVRIGQTISPDAAKRLVVDAVFMSFSEKSDIILLKLTANA
jgi:hypothetical protein